MSKINQKIILIFLSLNINLLTFLNFSTPVFADHISPQCSGKFSGYAQSAHYEATQLLKTVFPIAVNFTSKADTSFVYYIILTNFGTQIGPITVGDAKIRSGGQKITGAGAINFQIPNSNTDRVGSFRVTLMRLNTDNINLVGVITGKSEEPVCELGNINFSDKDLNEVQCNIRMPDNVQQDQSFSLNIEKIDKTGVEFYLHFFRAGELNIASIPKGLTYVEVPIGPLGGSLTKQLTKIDSVYSQQVSANTATATPPNLGYITLTIPNSGSSRLNGGEYIALLEVRKYLGRYLNPNINPLDQSSRLRDKWFVFYCSSHPFTVSTEPTTPEPQWTNGTPITQPGTGGTIGGGEITSETCLQRKAKDPSVQCTESGGQPCDTSGIATAIGCIHTQPAALVKDVLKFLIGISGGIALLLMALGAFGMITSAGNPESLQAGKDRFTQAFIGLLFVVFSVLLLQLIGVDILGIPGFGR